MKHSFVTLLDDYSRYTWVCLIQSKSEMFHVLKFFLSLIQNQFGVSIKMFRFDNGREFVNSQCDDLFKSKGIIHQTSCAYTPQQNGTVERKQKHFFEVARAQKFQSGNTNQILGGMCENCCISYKQTSLISVEWKITI